MTSTLFLGEDVGGALEVGVRGYRTRCNNNLATLYVFTLGTAKKKTTVLAGPCLVELLVEHLDTGHGRLLSGANTHNLDIRVDLQRATLSTAGHNGSTTSNREDVLHGHQERLVLVADGVWNAVVHGGHELHDLVTPGGVSFESLEAGHANNRSVVAVEALAGEQLANLDLDELEDFLVVDHVGLVQRDEQVRNTHLLGEQNVLTGLCHRTVSGGNHEDCTVHLCGTGDHVLDVVGVTGGVNVCIVTLVGLILHVGDVDGDTALTLFRSRVDGREVAYHVDC